MKLTLILQAESIHTQCITPSVPAEDLVEVCKELQPDVLGISLFSMDQVLYVQKVLDLLDSNRPKLIAVGGYLVKEKIIQLDQTIYIANSRNVDEVISKIKEACQSESVESQSA